MVAVLALLRLARPARKAAGTAEPEEGTKQQQKQQLQLQQEPEAVPAVRRERPPSPRKLSETVLAGAIAVRLSELVKEKQLLIALGWQGDCEAAGGGLTPAEIAEFYAHYGSRLNSEQRARVEAARAAPAAAPPVSCA